MWWLHEVEIHLAIGAFSLGFGFGMILTFLIVWLAKGSDKDKRD